MGVRYTDAGPGWTEARIETLKKLHTRGDSASQIAKELGGGLSRNAVIGKIHRMKLPLPADRVASKPARLPKPPAYAYKPPAAPRFITGSGGAPAPLSMPEPAPRAMAPAADQPTPIEARGKHYCRWPIGDPQSPTYGECGRPVGFREGGRPQTWCDDHRSIGLSAKQPTSRTLASLAGHISSIDYTPAALPLPRRRQIT